MVCAVSALVLLLFEDILKNRLTAVKCTLNQRPNKLKFQGDISLISAFAHR